MVTHAAGDGFCPFCEPKTCTLATRSAWASGHFRRKSRVAILLLVVGVTPTGNRDAGKFAADATQLPTGCQPESLAKPARRRSHKPQRVYRRPREKVGVRRYTERQKKPRGCRGFQSKGERHLAPIIRESWRL